MKWFHLRPTFQIEMQSSKPDLIQRLKAHYDGQPEPRLFLMHDGYGEIHMPSNEHRMWSPHLSFFVGELDQASSRPNSEQNGEKSSEPNCLIHGRFAPRMEVWTFVWVVYLSSAFTAFFALALAYSQWILDKHLWGLWAALISLTALVTLSVIAHVGQQLSADQMHILRDRLDEYLGSTDITPQH